MRRYSFNTIEKRAPLIQLLSLRTTAIVAEELCEIDGNINVVVDIHCFTSSGLNAHLNSVKIAVAICTRAENELQWTFQAWRQLGSDRGAAAGRSLISPTSKSTMPYFLMSRWGIMKVLARNTRIFSYPTSTFVAFEITCSGAIEYFALTFFFIAIADFPFRFNFITW